jgi:hypothetical protein
MSYPQPGDLVVCTMFPECINRGNQQNPDYRLEPGERNCVVLNRVLNNIIVVPITNSCGNYVQYRIPITTATNPLPGVSPEFTIFLERPQAGVHPLVDRNGNPTETCYLNLLQAQTLQWGTRATKPNGTVEHVLLAPRSERRGRLSSAAEVFKLRRIYAESVLGLVPPFPVPQPAVLAQQPPTTGGQQPPPASGQPPYPPYGGQPPQSRPPFGHGGAGGYSYHGGYSGYTYTQSGAASHPEPQAELDVPTATDDITARINWGDFEEIPADYNPDVPEATVEQSNAINWGDFDDCGAPALPPSPRGAVLSHVRSLVGLDTSISLPTCPPPPATISETIRTSSEPVHVVQYQMTDQRNIAIYIW